MRRPKHLPLSQWPHVDHEAFEIAYTPGDLFDGTAGPGAHLSSGTRRMIKTVYRRWLGFLTESYPSDLLKQPVDRLTPERVRGFIQHLGADQRPTTIAIAGDNLLYAARLLAPQRDWGWLTALKRRLNAQARPVDRFNRLVPGWQTLDLGIRLMDEAVGLPTRQRARDIQYRDGLLLALISCWPVRRRSISALTVSRHLEVVDGGINILLHAADTKCKRAEIFKVPDQLVPHLQLYLNEVRHRLLSYQDHDGLWASYRGGPLTAGRIYDTVRRETMDNFGKAMGLHDFRRASATFLATFVPDQVGLIPGILQHATDLSAKDYNLARSTEASRRFGAHLKLTRDRLRQHARR